MQKDLKELDTVILLDMLSDQTSDYIKLMLAGSKEDVVETCKLQIKFIQQELNFRKQGESNSGLFHVKLNGY